MKIGIDCRLSGPAHAGIGRYIEELILRLPKLDPQNSYFLFFYSAKQAQGYLKKLGKKYKNIKIIISPIKHYSIQEQFKLLKIFNQYDLGLLHVPHFNAPIFYHQKLIITIHDLLWHEYRGLHVTTLSPVNYLLKYLSYKLVTRQAIDKAQKILVPAETIKNIILKYYKNINKNKIIVTYEGVNHNFKIKNKKISAKGRPASGWKNNKQLIYVGSLYPHKNIKIILQALKYLPDHKLKLVGARDVFTDQIKKLTKKLKISKQVIFTGYLTDKQLSQELARSTALVQPSLSEGFGLTGIEAMAAGVPVLASKIAIFQEIYKTAAIYFDPHNYKSLIKALKKLEQSNQASLIKKAKNISQKYNWDKMAKETLAAYKKILL